MDGFRAEDFHRKCDNMQSTVSFVKSEFGKVFGGYASVSWTSQHPDKGKVDPKAFIFSLTHKTKHVQHTNLNMAVCADKECNVRFSGDIVLKDECNVNNRSYSNLGQSYKPPHGLLFNGEGARNYLAGQYNFRVTEIEVYRVVCLS